MPIGPALPPHLQHLAGRKSPVSDEEDEDDFGPALPPHLAEARKAVAGPSRPSQVYSSPSPPRLPGTGARHATKDTAGGSDDEEDSDDDVIGPMPTTETVIEKSAVEEFKEREARMNRQKEVRSVYIGGRWLFSTSICLSLAAGASRRFSICGCPS